MTFLLSSTIFLLLIGSATAQDPTVNNEYSFETYIQEYGKGYETEEEFIRRKVIFEQNREIIVQHEIQGDSYYTMGVNQFSDMFEEEMPLGYDKSFHPAWGSESTTTSQRRLGQTLVRSIC